MKAQTFNIKSVVWLYPGKAAWHFVTIQKEDAADIVASYPWPRKGFGSIPVHVTIGSSTWKTSIFPEKKGSFLLPLKKSVRDAEGIMEKDEVEILLQVVS